MEQYLPSLIWIVAAFLAWLTARYPLEYVKGWISGIFTTQGEVERLVRDRPNGGDDILRLIRYVLAIPPKLVQLVLLIFVCAAVLCGFADLWQIIWEG